MAFCNVILDQPVGAENQVPLGADALVTHMGGLVELRSNEIARRNGTSELIDLGISTAERD
jgi:hypothetical protein